MTAHMLDTCPFVASRMTVQPDWIDYNGHLNMAYYNVLFDRGLEEVFSLVGLGWDYLKNRGNSTFTAEVHIRYLRELHRQLRRPLLVVMDRLNVHRAAVRQLRKAGARWLDVEWLPAYAPELNPVEAIWSHAKYSTLANFVPDDVDHLRDAVIEAVGDLEWDQRLKESFFQTAKLSL